MFCLLPLSTSVNFSLYFEPRSKALVGFVACSEQWVFVKHKNAAVFLLLLLLFH